MLATQGTGLPKLHRLFKKFDPESAAVVLILLGIFQLLLSMPLYYLDISLPVLYVLPLIIGLLFVSAGSLTVACEKSPSRLLLKGCAYTNLAGLMGAMVALCIYTISLNSIQPVLQCNETSTRTYNYCPGEELSPPEPCVNETYTFVNPPKRCPGQYLTSYFWSLAVLLLIYDVGALILQSLLSFSALKGLKTN